MYKLKVAAVNSIGKGQWSNTIGYYAAAKPQSPSNFLLVSQSRTKLTVAWKAPIEDGGCPVTGYQIWIENISEPGFNLAYDGVSRSTQTSFTISYPYIQPGLYYKLKLFSKNCGLFSDSTLLTVASGSVPAQPPKAPYILSYDSSSSMTVKWDCPKDDGGFSIRGYRLYVDDSVEVELDPSANVFQLNSLILGMSLKL